MTDKPDVVCSFCSKNQHQVRKVIAGPDVFICNECTDLCSDIVHEGEGNSVRRWALDLAVGLAHGDPTMALEVAARFEAYVVRVAPVGFPAALPAAVTPDDATRARAVV